jgi:hypothetical protein
MSKRVYRNFGLALIVVGVFLLLNSFQGVTGFVILEDADVSLGYFFGAAFLIVGILLLMAGRGGLEEISSANVKLEPTRGFSRDIRGHDLNRINTTLRKIGTGLGDEHRLTTGDYSISNSKGGRVVFRYDPKHTTATLEAFDEGHGYDKMLRGRR